MRQDPVERGILRLRILAWGSALLALSLVALRLAQGVLPDQLSSFDEIQRSIRDTLQGGLSRWEFKILMGAVGTFSVLILVLMVLARGRFLGLTRSGSASGSRINEGLARLIELGFNVGPEQPLPGGGFSVLAKRPGQTFHLKVEEGCLTVRDRSELLRPPIDAAASGTGLVEAFVRGRFPLPISRSLPRPTVLLMGVGLLLGAVGIIVHLLDRDYRWPWLAMTPFIAAGGLSLSCILGVWLLCDRSRATGFDLVLASVILVGTGGVLWAQRPDPWQTVSWWTTRDGWDLVRAWHSACFEVGWNRSPRRFKEALEVREGAKKRLLAMGEQGVKAVLTCPDANLYLCPNLCVRFQGLARKHALENLTRENEVVRERCVEVLRDWSHEPVVVSAVMSAFRDPCPNVRRAAARFFSAERPERWLAPARHAEAGVALASLIRDPDEWTVQAALQAVRHQRPPEAVPALIDLVERPPSKEMRKEAAETLGKYPDLRAFPAVFRFAQEEVDGSLLWNYLDSFKTDPDGILSLLLDMLERDSSELGENLIEGLLRSRWVNSTELSGAVPAITDLHLDRLLRMAEDDTGTLRRTAVRLLAYSKDPRAQGRVLRSLDSPEEALSVILPLRARGLVSSQKVIRTFLHCPLTLYYEAVRQPVYAVDDELAETLFSVAMDHSVPSQTRVYAAAFLEKAREEVRLRLSGRLAREGDSVVRIVSFGRKSSREELEAFLRDDDPKVRGKARDVLRFRADPASAPTFAALIVEDPDPSQAASLAGTLFDIDPAAASRALLERLSRRGGIASLPRAAAGRSEWDAVNALTRSRDPGAIPYLRAWIKELEARKQSYGSSHVVSALVRLKCPDVMQEARTLLLRPRGSGGCKCGNGIVCDAAECLATCDETAAGWVFEALEEDEIRPAVAEAIGMTRSPRALETLVNLANDPVYAVRRGAAFGFGRLGDRRATPHLLRLLHDPSEDVAAAAAWSLQELLGHPLGVALSPKAKHTVTGFDRERIIKRMHGSVLDRKELDH